METSLPTPMTARVYVNLPEGTHEKLYIICWVHVQIIQLIEIPLIYIRQWQEHLLGGHWCGGARLRHPQGAVDDVEKWRGKPGKHGENTGRMEELGTCSKQLEKKRGTPGTRIGKHVGKAEGIERNWKIEGTPGKEHGASWKHGLVSWFSYRKAGVNRCWSRKAWI